MAGVDMSKQLDEPAGELFRGMPPRVARVRAIEANARLLRPTKASLAAATTKRLTGQAKERAEMQSIEGRRRKLSRVAKANGRLTIPTSPKFQRVPAKTAKSKLLTMTSRELMEIEAIRNRVKKMRRKTQNYLEKTTRAPILPAKTSADSTSSSSFESVRVPWVNAETLTGLANIFYDYRQCARPECRASRQYDEPSSRRPLGSISRPISEQRPSARASSKRRLLRVKHCLKARSSVVGDKTKPSARTLSA